MPVCRMMEPSPSSVTSNSNKAQLENFISAAGRSLRSGLGACTQEQSIVSCTTNICSL